MPSDPDRSRPSAEQLASVAVFPLPNVVLFPGARLPLHVFEPRYREMMRDVLAGGSGLMIVARLEPGWQREYAGQPPMAEIAGLGRIERSEHNADGTYDLELLGLARARLAELPMDGKPYRRARATLLDETSAGLLDTELTSLFSLASQIAALVRKREPRFRLLAAPDDPAGLLIDRISDQLVGDSALRQRLLETLDVRERLELVTSQIAQLQLTLLAGESGGTVMH